MFPRFQFRLRSLFLLMLVLAVPLAWLGQDLQKYRVQRQALDRLATHQATWAITAMSRFGFSKVEGLWLTGPVDVDDARHVSELPYLNRLELHDCQITDDAWDTIGRIERLTSLHIAYTDMSDEQVLMLKPLKNLRELSLTSTGVTEAAVSELERALPELRVADD